MRNKPELSADLLLFWNCFVDLDSSRTCGMEANAIQPSAVWSWCQIKSLDEPQLIEDIWMIVHLVDQHRMKSMRDQPEPNKPAKTNANPSRSN